LESKAVQVGELDGAPVFQMPSQDLGAKAPVTATGPQARINPVQTGANRNPRFRAPKKP
jgi:hypothetical protein